MIMPESGVNIKALVVDDQPAIVDLLVMIMESIGVKPIRAYDGEMALAKFLEEQPDIVFTDIYMPNMNGFVLLKKLKFLNKNLPVIIFTGYHHYKSMASEVGTKPDHFLVKPLDAREIIEIMLNRFPALRR